MMHSIPLDLMMVFSLALLGFGYFYKKNSCHIFRACGWIVFGLYWFWQFPYWFVQDETLNLLGTLASLPVFSFLAYHEYLSWKWKEDYQPLKFIAGACFLGSALFFIIDMFPAISQAIIQIVSDQTAWLVNVFTNKGYSLSYIDLKGNTLWYTSSDNEITAYLQHGSVMSQVSIVLACTGIQAIVATFAFLLYARATLRSRLKSIILIIPTIYIVNLFRNALIVYSVDFAIFGDSTFDIVHNIIGEIVITMTTLIVLMVIAFMMLPGFYEDLNGLFDLPWRKAPGHDYLRYIGRLMAPKKKANKES